MAATFRQLDDEAFAYEQTATRDDREGRTFMARLNRSRAEGLRRQARQAFTEEYGETP